MPKTRTFSCVSTSSTEETPKRVKYAEDMTPIELSDLLDEKLSQLKKDIILEITSLIEQKVTALTKKVDSLKHQNEIKDIQILHLEENLLAVQRHAMRNEQYTRRENVRVLGIEEEEGENCATKMFEFFRTKLHSDIKSENITVAHRVKGGSPRGIIVRFSSREVKSAIIQNRRILKGSGVVINEDL